MTHFEIRNTDYTTLDRRMTFRFDFIQLESGLWRMYIVRQPSYETRSTSSLATHRLNDARGTYVCWDAPITTLDAAKGVARAWADATHAYIETGRFPPPGPARPVPDWSTSSEWPLAARAGVVHTSEAEAGHPAASPARSSAPYGLPSTSAAAPSTPNLRQRLLRTWRNL